MDINDKTEQLMEDIYDRLSVVPTSLEQDDEFKGLIDRYEKLGRLRNESKRIDMETEVEMRKIDLEIKKLDLEKDKFKKSDDWKNARMWLEGLGFPMAILGTKWLILTVQTIEATKFEKSDITTLSAMKGVTRYVQDGISSIFRGN